MSDQQTITVGYWTYTRTGDTWEGICNDDAFTEAWIAPEPHLLDKIAELEDRNDELSMYVEAFLSRGDRHASELGELSLLRLLPAPLWAPVNGMRRIVDPLRHRAESDHNA